jgi:diadenosine tetraphosphate (Ap4A) HIT family hydrolase
MDNPTNCIFCRIVRGQAEASIVYEDDTVVAFLDAHPVAEGHTLVVPRRHASDLENLDDLSAAGLLSAGRRIGLGLRSALGADGVNLHMADGEAAGQTVFHVHLHVIPRRSGDGFGLRIPFGTRPTPDRASLQTVAGRLRQAVGESAGA